MSDIATLSIKVDSSDVKGATQAMGGLTNAGGLVEGMVAKLAAAFAAWQLAGMVKESALLAARYETLGVVMGVMGNNVGHTATQMAQFQEGLEATGISMVGARQSLNMMAAAQLNLAQSSDLARVAQDAAVISGTNSTEAFEALTRSIQTGMVVIAHRAGIMVSYEKAEKEFAATLGKTKEQLTSQELAQARLNAVLEEGRKRQGAYEASMETAGKQLLSMERYVENFKVKFGEAFGPLLKVLVSDMSKGLKAASEWIDKNAVGMANFAEAMRSTAVAGEAFLANLSQMAGGAGTASSALDGLSWVVKGIGFTVALASDALKELVVTLLKVIEIATFMPDEWNPWKKWTEEIKGQQQALDKFMTSIEQGNQRVSDTAIKTERLAAAQDLINKYTGEYDRLQKAMANAPNSVTDQHKDLLNQLGILRDYAKQRKLEIAQGIEEVTGPRTNTSIPNAPPRVDTKYTDREYDRLNESLQKQLYLLKYGEEAAFAHDLQIKKNRDGTAAFTAAQQEHLKATKAEIIAEQDAQKLRDAIWETQQGNYRKEMDILNQYGQAKNEFMFAELDAAQKNEDENKKVAASLAMVSKLYDDGSITQRQYTDRVVDLNKQLHLETGIFGDLRDTIQDWSKSSTDAFVEFCFTGKNSFGDLINSMLRDLARLAVQKEVMGPIWGYISGGISAWAGGSGASTAANGQAYSGSTFGYANGGNPPVGTPYLVGENGPELRIDRTPGTIIPNSALGGQQVVNHISVTVQEGKVSTSSQSSDQKGNNIAKDLEGMMNQWAAKHMRKGGMLEGARA